MPCTLPRTLPDFPFLLPLGFTLPLLLLLLARPIRLPPLAWYHAIYVIGHPVQITIGVVPMMMVMGFRTNWCVSGTCGAHQEPLVT